MAFVVFLETAQFDCAGLLYSGFMDRIAERTRELCQRSRIDERTTRQFVSEAHGYGGWLLEPRRDLGTRTVN